MKSLFIIPLVLMSLVSSPSWAVTFKDGKVSKDNQVEEPAQNVERKSSGAGEI